MQVFSLVISRLQLYHIFVIYSHGAYCFSRKFDANLWKTHKSPAELQYILNIITQAPFQTLSLFLC